MQRQRKRCCHAIASHTQKGFLREAFFVAQLNENHSCWRLLNKHIRA
jgi:hypothetical protein